MMVQFDSFNLMQWIDTHNSDHRSFLLPVTRLKDHAGDDDFDDADVGDYQRSQRKDGETYDYGHSEVKR
jgi:hypothetical protein